MGEISNIDELLMGMGNSQQATTPEHKNKLQKESEEQEPVEELEDDEKEEGWTYAEEDKDEEDTKSDEEEGSDDDDEDSEDDKKPNESENDLDEYGNKKERMSKGMKDRLDRKEKQHQRDIEDREREIQNLRHQLSQQGASKEVQQAVKDFKYDANDEAGWEQQLSDFVKATVSNLQADEQRQVRERKEQATHQEFQKKFTKGMERFDDFREVVGSQPIDDAMTLALRGIADPTAFIYAASKRNPQDLERISKLSDPYARMVEMGRLEERMRRAKPVTKAPRPLGRTREDSTAKVTPNQKDTSGDDLLAKADAKRLSIVRTRHKNNR